MGQRFQGRGRFGSGRLGLEWLEDRRVLTGLLGNLLPSLPLQGPPPPAASPTSLVAPLASGVVDDLIGTGISALAGPAAGLLPDLSVDLVLNVSSSSQSLLPDVAVSSGVSLGNTATGLVPTLDLNLDLALQPTESGLVSTNVMVQLDSAILPNITLDISAAIKPGEGGLLQGLVIDTQISLLSTGDSLLIAIAVDMQVIVETVPGNLLPNVDLGIDGSVTPAGPAILPDIGVVVGATVDPTGSLPLPSGSLGGGILVTLGPPGAGSNINIGGGVNVGPPLPGPGDGGILEIIPINPFGSSVVGEDDLGGAAEARQPDQGPIGATPDVNGAVPPTIPSNLLPETGTDEPVGDPQNEESPEGDLQLELDMLAPLDEAAALGTNHEAEALTTERAGGWLTLAEAAPLFHGLQTAAAGVNPVVFEMAGLLDGMILDAAALEQALQSLLDCLQDLAQWLTASGLYPWLMTLLVAAAAGELARRNLRRPQAAGASPLAAWWLTGLVPVSE